MIIRAMNLVDVYFKDKKDKGGNPYTEHLIYIMQRVETTEEKVVALLHDIIEDTEVTEKDLLEYGLPQDLIDIINIMTKRTDELYEDYINRIIESKNQIAINVKIIDLEHNMNLDRLKLVTEEDIVRKDKYSQAYKKLLSLKMSL